MSKAEDRANGFWRYEDAGRALVWCGLIGGVGGGGGVRTIYSYNANVSFID